MSEEKIYPSMVIRTQAEAIELLEKENQHLKEELQKADSITQSCIFNGKKESELNFRRALNLVKELRQENQQLKEKAEYLKSKIENKDKWCQLIADIGYDYDGYNDSKNLKLLIDELVKYNLYARDDYSYEEFLKEEDNEFK